MKWIRFFILLALALLLPLTPAVHAGALACPTENTDDAMEDFRDSAVKTYNTGDYGTVLQQMTSCFPSGAPSCLDDLKYQTKLRSNQPGPGGNPADLTISSINDLPPEFRVPPDRFRIPPDIKALAAQKGWKVISYKTRSTGGFDGAPNLTLVVIPGPTKDIYIQISPPPEPDSRTPAVFNNPTPQGDMSRGQSTATIITVDKSKNPPVGQLRHESGNGSDYGFTNSLTSQGCIECHSSPLRSISPRGYGAINGDEQPMSAEDQRTVREINNMMIVPNMAWGNDQNGIRRGHAMDSQPYGWAPPNSPTRKPDFINNCAQGAQTASYCGFGGYCYNQTPQQPMTVDTQKVAAMMNCVQCHDGNIKGPLSGAFSQREIQFKVLVDRSMPPGMDLTPNERLALVNCLFQERNTNADQWKQRGDWAKKAACDAGDTGSGSIPGAADTSTGR